MSRRPGTPDPRSNSDGTSRSLQDLLGLKAVQIGLLGGVIAVVVVGGIMLFSGGGSNDDQGATAQATSAGITTTPGAATTVTPRAATAVVAATTATSVPTPATYTVKAGDTASQIAKTLGVKDADLAGWLRDFTALNGDPSLLQVGQVVKLPGGTAPGSTAAAPGATGGSSPSPSPGSGPTATPETASTAAAAATSTAVTSNTAVATTVAAPTSTPPSAPTPQGPPSISLSPTRATAGTAITLTLRNFPPSSEVRVCFVIPSVNYRDCGGIDVDANGYFSAPGDPLDADVKNYPGTYVMEATGANGTTVSASFEVY